MHARYLLNIRNNSLSQEPPQNPHLEISWSTVLSWCLKMYMHLKVIKMKVNYSEHHFPRRKFSLHLTDYLFKAFCVMFLG